MRRLLIGVCIAMAITLCLAATSRAHKVNLFAYVDGNSIVADSGYKGWVGVEWEGKTPDELSGILLTKRLIELLQQSVVVGTQISVL